MRWRARVVSGGPRAGDRQPRRLRHGGADGVGHAGEAAQTPRDHRDARADGVEGAACSGSLSTVGVLAPRSGPLVGDRPHVAAAGVGQSK